eukprot:SAG31_NODE_11809_length_996_cov_1.094760_2_plen_111_part_00
MQQLPAIMARSVAAPLPRFLARAAKCCPKVRAGRVHDAQGQQQPDRSPDRLLTARIERTLCGRVTCRAPCMARARRRRVAINAWGHYAGTKFKFSTLTGFMISNYKYLEV